MRQLPVVLTIALPLFAGDLQAQGIRDLSPEQRAELTVFGLNVGLALRISPKALQAELSDDDLGGLVATALEILALRCARVTGVEAVDTPGRYRVTCSSEPRSEQSHVYMVDALRGAAAKAR